MIDVEDGTFKESCEQIRQMASEAFARHELTLERSERWLCKRPDSGTYWFRVVTAPGTIIILGDLGEFVLRPYCKEEHLVDWLRGASGSPGYLVEKITASRHYPKAFYPAECMRSLADYVGDFHGERRRQLRKCLAVAREMYRDGNLTHERWLTLAYDYGLDDFHSVGLRLSSSMLWMVEVCKTFIRLHDAEKTEAAA